MKLNSLRDAIAAALPDLAANPEHLAMWIEKGHIRSPMTVSRDFEWNYTLNITVQDMTAHPSVLYLVINDWLRVNQPEVLQPGHRHGYQFEADVVDENTIDLHVQLDLTERVRVTSNADGSDSIEHLDEPPTWFPDDEPLSAAALALLRMNDDQILPGPPLS